MKRVLVKDWFENIFGMPWREATDSNRLAREYNRRQPLLAVNQDKNDVVVIHRRDGSALIVHNSELYPAEKPDGKEESGR